jgi:hypothetical protein
MDLKTVLAKAAGAAGGRHLGIDVVEDNPYAPQPFVFSELAACLCASIRQLGFADCRHVVNQVDQDRLALVFMPNPGWESLVSRLNPRLTVLINLEQLGSESALLGNGYVDELARWPVLDYSSANIEFLRQRHGARQLAFELPFVPGPAAIFRPELAVEEKSVDVLFFGTLSDRRSLILEQLRAAGLTVEVVAGAYAWELTPAVLRARMVLHIHYYSTKLFPISRMLQPVANGVPVVCETSVHADLSDWSRSGMVFADYEQLVATCVALLDSPQQQLDAVQRTLRFARQLDFERPFMALLQGLAQRDAQAPIKSRAAAGDGLSHEEIDTILRLESTQLPPPADVRPAPIVLAQRRPSEGRFGRIGMLVYLGFVLFTLWQTLK